MNADRTRTAGLCALKLLALLAGYLLTLLAISFVWVVISGIENYPESFDAAERQLLVLGGAAFLISVYGFYRRKGLDFFAAAGLVKANVSVRDYALCAGFGAGANLLLVLVLGLLPERMTAGYATSVTEAMAAGGLIFNAVNVLVVAPVAEELVFRGLCFGYLCACMKPYHAAALLSLVFGLSHGNPVWACYAVLMGFAFAVMRIRLNSVLPVIAAHIAFNAASLVVFLCF